MPDMFLDPDFWRIFICLCLVYFFGRFSGYQSGYSDARNFYFGHKEDQV